MRHPPTYPAARAFPPSPARNDHACFRALADLRPTSTTTGVTAKNR
nr:MAG TPA: hypothetical protein [Caudoviricetes sp.]